MFGQLSERLSDAFKSLRGHGRLTPADIDRVVREIRAALLEADVALPTVRAFTDRVRTRAAETDLTGQLNPAQTIVKIVHEELVEVLGGDSRRLTLAKQPPTVIMLVGLQGAGKTTLAGKLALHLKGQGHTPLLVAADLQRPNAVDQLTVVGQRVGVPTFAPQPGNGVGDPVQVARDAIAHARQRVHDIVIVDTAGRLAIDEELMAQARAIRDAVSPDEVLFVVDAMIGQDAVRTAAAFDAGVGFDGVVLTKLDGDARGGAALSIRELTGKPILFASTGERFEDFEPFHPDRMASRILDMGDVLTLIEQAERAFDAEQRDRFTRKMESGDDFTLEDFVEQLQALRSMGPMSKMLGMLPGAGQMKQQLDNLDERELDRTAAIVYSMTPAERRDPRILNASRRARIARGSGTTVTAVNSLVNRFEQAQKLMKQAAKGGGLPGMGPMPGAPRPPKPQPPKKAKSRSGNPARRAVEEAGGTYVDPTVPEKPFTPDDLPAGFKRLLGR